MQITDMHPAYSAKTSESTACHRKKGKKEKNTAGYYCLSHSCVRATLFCFCQNSNGYSKGMSFALTAHQFHAGLSGEEGYPPTSRVPVGPGVNGFQRQPVYLCFNSRKIRQRSQAS
ncbi:hypothetical protein B0H10DRAFT_2048450 [Mycena sp. CBHHK59/15]|nr:hypothetical protein B0H10DRAFT_2048450 [Mycena sp. CBHHK59/15]